MDNKTKQYLSGLEARVMRLENMLEASNQGMQSAAALGYNCDMCGAYDPVNTNYVCSMPDCCQGLNPADDNEPPNN